MVVEVFEPTASIPGVGLWFLLGLYRSRSVAFERGKNWI